jgi:hypothetical protein
MAEKNYLWDKTPSQLHDEGLDYLLKARQSPDNAAQQAAHASTAIGFFFASMSADNLGSLVGAHRTDENTPPHGVPPALDPNQYTGHHA